MNGKHKVKILTPMTLLDKKRLDEKKTYTA